jgi:hypothetical protein
MPMHMYRMMDLSVLALLIIAALSPMISFQMFTRVDEPYYMDIPSEITDGPVHFDEQGYIMRVVA